MYKTIVKMYKTSQAHRQNVQDFINIVTRFGVFYMYLFLREDKVSVGTLAFRNSHQHFASRGINNYLFRQLVVYA